MQKFSFETNHISEENMMTYIALPDLSGEKKAFAKQVQKHLCICEACRVKLRLLEKLSESAQALGRYERKIDSALETDLINKKSASAEYSRLFRSESENSAKKLFR